MDRIEIHLPLPPADTRPNARVHWARKAKAAARQRQDARLAALASLGTRRPPRWKRAEIEATLYRSNPRCRRADGDNVIGWLKATFDGLQDAGIVANDCGFIHLPPVQVLGAEARTKNLLVVRIAERLF